MGRATRRAPATSREECRLGRHGAEKVRCRQTQTRTLPSSARQATADTGRRSPAASRWPAAGCSGRQIGGPRGRHSRKNRLTRDIWSTPVNATRANGGLWGGNGEHLPYRGQATEAHRRCRSSGRPDACGRGQAGDVDRRGQHLPDRGQRLMFTGGADRVGVRLPGAVGVGQTSTSYTLRRQSTWPQGRDFRRWTRQTATSRRRGHCGSTCRIAAERLTLTGGADCVGVRLHGTVGVGQHLPDRG